MALDVLFGSFQYQCRRRAIVDEVPSFHRNILGNQH